MVTRNIKLSHYRNLLNVKATQYIDEKGYTPLHKVIRFGSTYHDIESYIRSLDFDTLSVMSRTVSNKGYLPYDFLKKNNNISEDEEEKLAVPLFKAMTENEVPALSAKINIDEIMERYYPLNNQHLNYNLKIAYEAAEEARSIIKESVTHPSLNHASSDKQNMTGSKLLITRIAHLEHKESIDQDYIKYVTKIVKLTQTANCDEASMVCLHYLTHNNPSAYGSTQYIETGDHAIVTASSVSNDSTNSEIESGVTIDTHHADIYPIFETYLRLNTLKCYPIGDDKLLRIITTFNPAYHEFKHKRNIQKSIDLSTLNLSHSVIFPKSVADKLSQEKLNEHTSSRAREESVVIKNV